MLIVVKNLTLRNGHFAYRKAVPKDLQPLLNKREWTKSFKGLTEAQATAKCQALNTLYDRQVKTIRGNGALRQTKQFAEDYVRQHPDLLDKTVVSEAGGYTLQDMELSALENDYDRYVVNPDDPNSKFVDNMPSIVHDIVQTAMNDGIYVPATHKLSSIYDYYIEQRFKGETDKPTKFAVDSLTNFLGDKELSSIRRPDIQRWITECRKIQKDSTIRRRLNALNAMVNKYLLDLELSEPRNPFMQHGIGTNHSGNEKLPFNKAHLAAIDAYIRDSKISMRNKALLVLMKFTGAGLSELCGLEQRDVVLSTATPYIFIRPNSIRDHLKTEARERRIPLLSEAKTLVTPLKTDDSQKPLWGEIINTHSLSASLNKAIRAAGIPKSPRLTANCFRHTLEEAMRVAETPEVHQKAILGHSKKDITAKYGAPSQSLEALLKTLKKAKKKLGEVYEDNYLPEELISKS